MSLQGIFDQESLNRKFKTTFKINILQNTNKNYTNSSNWAFTMGNYKIQLGRFRKQLSPFNQFFYRVKIIIFSGGA